MKKSLLILAIFCLILNSAFGIEEIPEEITPDFTLEETVPKRVVIDYVEKIVAPKKIQFENNFFNEIQYGLNYKGTLNFNMPNDESLTTKYNLLFEPYFKTKFGERKNEIFVAFIPTRDTSKMDRKFWGLFSNLQYQREIVKNHYVTIGNSRTPIGYEGGMSAYTLPFINRSQIATKYGNAWVPGVRFQGDFGFLDYDLGGYSSTRCLQKITEGAEFTGWVNLKPFYKKEGHALQKLKVGAGIDVGKRHKSYNVTSFLVNWENEKYLASLEYGIANGSNGSSGPDFNKTQGGNVTLGYKFNKKWQILGRYDVFDTNRNKSHDLKTQYSAGLNYFLIEDRLKFAINYIFEHNQNKANRNMVLFLTQIRI